MDVVARNSQSRPDDSQRAGEDQDANGGTRG
jgi:hypothetical protein